MERRGIDDLIGMGLAINRDRPGGEGQVVVTVCEVFGPGLSLASNNLINWSVGGIELSSLPTLAGVTTVLLLLGTGFVPVLSALMGDGVALEAAKVAAMCDGDC